MILQSEQSGGVGSIPGRAPPLEHHDKGSRTRLALRYFCSPRARRKKPQLHLHPCVPPRPPCSTTANTSLNVNTSMLTSSRNSCIYIHDGTCVVATYLSALPSNDNFSPSSSNSYHEILSLETYLLNTASKFEFSELKILTCTQQ